MKKIILILLLFLMICFFIGVFTKWKHCQQQEEEDGTITKEITRKKEEECSTPIIRNENYVEKPKEEKEIIQIETNEQFYEWVKNYSQSLMSKFMIDHGHREIFKTIHEYIVQNQLQEIEECDLLHVVFSQCKTISIAKKMEIAVYIVWKSNNQQHIDNVYNTILAIASDDQENPKTRANALEILMRSNNKIYIERSKRIMETLKEYEKIQEMEQIRQRMERIQNVMHVNPTTLRRTPTPPRQNLQGQVPLTQEDIQVQNILLDQYRRLERRAFNAMKHKTVYDDTQNVHNHKINNSVIQSMQNMMEVKPPSSPMFQVEKELETYYPNYKKHEEKIKSSLHRIRTDASKFKNSITVSQVFDRIISIISGSKYKQEMWKRLGEELVEMNQLCATGHLSRIINVIQGFEDVPVEFQIKMDPKDEIYANLSNYITMQIQNSGESDKLLESMIDPENRTLFIEFVIIILKPKVNELRKEYETIVEPIYLQKCIHDSIRTYIKNEQETNRVIASLSQE